jgi:cobalt-zinc-cadmium efflux system membrane fusion protein
MIKELLVALVACCVIPNQVMADEGTDHHTDEVKLTSDAIQRYGIKTAAISVHQLKPILTVPARVAFNAEAMAHVGAVVKGRATEIKARVGDLVKKGDELLVVESSELGETQSDFLQKRTAVSVAESAIEPAKNAAERARKLFDQNQGIALGEVQKREADWKAAEGALQTAQAALTAAENKLHLMGMSQDAVKALAKSTEIDPHYAVRAPIAGQVIEREVTLGELVGPEKEALLVLADMQTLWVLADVPETRLREVAVGAKARLTLTAIPDAIFAGTVSFISPTLDPDTRTARVRIDVTNAGDLRPGMFATAQIVANHAVTTAPAALAVPDEAVQTVEGGPAVFVPVEGEENTFAKRAITVGKSIGGWAPVISGLKEGEQIVINGSFILKAELGKGEAAHEH